PMGLAKPAVALAIWLAVNLLFLALWRPMPPRLRVTLLVTTLFAVMGGLAVSVYHENHKQEVHAQRVKAMQSASVQKASEASAHP
ncbi:MAG: hypothetical protein ACXU8O_07650, partial [Asticcacaulis sp.]